MPSEFDDIDGDTQPMAECHNRKMGWYCWAFFVPGGTFPSRVDVGEKTLGSRIKRP